MCPARAHGAGARGNPRASSGHSCPCSSWELGTCTVTLVSPLPVTSQQLHARVTAQQRGGQKCVEGGVRGVQWLCRAGQDSPRLLRPEPPARGRVPRPVGLSVPEGPQFIYAHHFLPPGTLLLPNTSALLPDFCHLFWRSWCRSESSLPLLEVTPEQG